MVSPELSSSLEIGSGICWTLVYLLIIRLGYKETTYGMPLAALCANVSWEFIFSFIYPHEPPQSYINLTWFLFDLVILFQTLQFGQRAFAPSNLFYPALTSGLLLSFCVILGISQEFADRDGKYAAFGQNLMMSILFIAMLVRRPGVEGQSVYIALFKLLGTLLPSILFHLRFPRSFLLNVLYVAIFVFDLAYLLMLYRRHTSLALNPWARV
ncbi:MAG TPA: hypothetical protein VIB79_26815 [Candidatus Binatia bacterium]